MDDREDGIISLRLSRAQALVVFELLSRETTEKDDSISFIDPSELHALWNIEGQLEKQLFVELISEDYASLLAKAREEWRNPPAG